MSMQSFFEKLQLKDEKNLLIQGLPSSIEKQFVKLFYSKNVTPLLKTKKVDFALIFVISQNQLCNLLREVLPALHAESKLWVAYPKTSSKIASDLNRDCSWQALSDYGYEAIKEVALDHMWTAMRFQKMEAIPNRAKAFAEVQNAAINGIEFDKQRHVMPPAELEPFFVKHKEAKEFFTSLSFTNQKEYITWIEGAKKAETKQRRLEVVQEKLLAGKKTPTEK
jgi:hypothetical protein